MKLRSAVLSMAFSTACVSYACGAEIAVFPSVTRDPGFAIVGIKGELDFSDREDFLSKIAAYPRGLVLLNSPGGNAYAGIAIGRAIRMKGYSTYIPGGAMCASACASIWIGGRKRLMGSKALVGFHASYLVKNGAAVESGSGNAVFGAYLSEIGIPENTIAYLTDAAPNSMNWLTVADVNKLGIDAEEYDYPEGEPAPSQPPAQAPAQVKVIAPTETIADTETSLTDRSRQMVSALMKAASAPADKYLGLLDVIYANRVNYFDEDLGRDQIATKIGSFLARWPQRSYILRPDKLVVNCTVERMICTADGVFHFDAVNWERKRHSHGEATFSYTFVFTSGVKYPVVAREGGNVLQREVDPTQ
jgi:hypothetical protein